MSPMPQRRWFQLPRATYLWVAVFVVFAAGYLRVEFLLRRRTVPPSTVTDVISFLKWHPNPTAFRLVQRGNQEHLFVRGENGGILTSETSGYAFDRTGRLVDWSRDSGDDPDFQTKWLRGGASRPILQEEALSWLKNRDVP